MGDSERIEIDEQTGKPVSKSKEVATASSDNTFDVLSQSKYQTEKQNPKHMNYIRPKSQSNLNIMPKDFIYIARYQDTIDQLSGRLRSAFDCLKNDKDKMSNGVNYMLLINDFNFDVLNGSQSRCLLNESHNWNHEVFKLIIKLLRKEKFGNMQLPVDEIIFKGDEINIENIKNKLGLIGHSEDIDKKFLEIETIMRGKGYFLNINYLFASQYSYIKDLLENANLDIFKYLLKHVKSITFKSLSNNKLRKIIKYGKMENLQFFIDAYNRPSIRRITRDNILEMILYGNRTNLEWIFRNISMIENTDFDNPFITDLVCNFDLSGIKFPNRLYKQDIKGISGKTLLELVYLDKCEQLPQVFSVLLKSLDVNSVSYPSHYFNPVIIRTFCDCFNNKEGLIITNKDKSRKFFVMRKDIENEGKPIILDINKQRISLLPDRIDRKIAKMLVLAKKKSKKKKNIEIIMDLNKIEPEKLNLTKLGFDNPDQLFAVKHYVSRLCNYIAGKDNKFLDIDDRMAI